jgi:4-diphosphocytidyl-2-C-methyl-D-erythritol kinase
MPTPECQVAMPHANLFAPAKINLYLHITGQRADGYHFLDSLVAFVDVGDRLWVEEAPSFRLSVTGPMAAALAHEDPLNNLIARAAYRLAESLGRAPNVHLTLEKNLPVASGIGGGSTDAAAALKLLAGLWEREPNDPRLTTLAAHLGQDVPCCLSAQTCYFRGIGDTTDEGPTLPTTPVLLVNPRKALPTPTVYKARQGAFQPEARLEGDFSTPATLAARLKERTNGLTEAAISCQPVIGETLRALDATTDVLLSRMSGSGASCFALYPTAQALANAAAELQDRYPDWWIAPTFIPFTPEKAAEDRKGQAT